MSEKKNYPKGIFGTDRTTSSGKELLATNLTPKFFEWAVENGFDKTGVRLTGWKKDADADTKYGTRDWSIDTYVKPESTEAPAASGEETDLPF
jgi:hypothetical protein